jgi:hypothetical protein
MGLEMKKEFNSIVPIVYQETLMEAAAIAEACQNENKNVMTSRKAEYEAAIATIDDVNKKLRNSFQNKYWQYQRDPKTNRVINEPEYQALIDKWDNERKIREARMHTFTL